MQVIPVNRVVDKKRLIAKNRGPRRLWLMPDPPVYWV
jgi:hypothetical protein